MLMTEEQARKKWCHIQGNRHFRVTAEPQNTFDVPSVCDASDCMMWRWHGKDCTHELPPKPSEASKLNTVDCDCPCKGYCGLAGKP